MKASLPKRTKYTITITLNSPEIIYKKSWIKEYIKEAINSWHGSYSSTSPLFNNIKKVTVK